MNEEVLQVIQKLECRLLYAQELQLSSQEIRVLLSYIQSLLNKDNRKER